MCSGSTIGVFPTAAKSDFLDIIQILPEHIHPMPVDVPPAEGAVKYRAGLAIFFESDHKDVPAFDLVFLGIGQDGHPVELVAVDHLFGVIDDTTNNGGGPKATTIHSLLPKRRSCVS